MASRTCCARRMQQQVRAFSSTAARPIVPKTNILSLLAPDAPPPPPYPYPRNQWYKQANHGLYGGVTIQFGNNVSEEFETKTRRTWSPNIKYKYIWSQALGQKLRLKVSTRVLKTIDKVGGLDNYVLGRTPQRIKDLGEEGWKLRWAVLNSPSVRDRARSDKSIQRMLGGHPDDLVLPAFGSAADGELAEADEILEVEPVDANAEETEIHMHEAPQPPSPSGGVMGSIRDGASEISRNRA